MDEWTRERYPVIPYEERYAKPGPPPHRPRFTAAQIAQHRLDLCGTDDLELGQQGGATGESKRLRLLEVIRRWKA